MYLFPGDDEEAEAGDAAEDDEWEDVDSDSEDEEPMEAS